MRKLFGLAAMLACFCLAFSGQSASAADEIRLRLSCPVATKGSFMGDSIELWKKLIEEKSGGRIKISLHYSGELGSEGETFDQHYKGTVPLLLTYSTTRYSEKLGLLSTPYLFDDWNDVREAFAPDGWMTEVYGKIYEEVGLKFLAPYPGGFGGVDTKGKYATNIASAREQGIKVRCAAIFPLAETMQALGYQVIPVDWNETYTAIQTGLVDGSSNNPIFWTYDTFRDLLEYFVDTSHTFSSADMTMNLDAWNKLSPEDQKIILDSALEVAAKQFEDAEKTDLHYRQLSIDHGIKYIKPTPEEIAEMKKVCQEQIWPLVEKVVGAELMALVRANSK
ncbi:MAG: TRAP transporter substrate-binding protein DctP [Deltaproteobacteria bacterium]|jgi:TRAP-type C4-dicarboxylate transport system substrate-binding protein|nr:TRAP transporter substrate-binding protein DctP [Deltaproteobacteria bacterium]